MVLKIVEMKRSYEQLIKQHFADHTQMALLTGPRQVGKTTTSQSIQSKNNTYYFNWDDIEDRQRILQGGQVIAAYINIDRLRDKVQLVIFDEIHKYSQWKSFIKGFYDRYHKECRILVTGSARLDVFKKEETTRRRLIERVFFCPFPVAMMLRSDSASAARSKVSKRCLIAAAPIDPLKYIPKRSRISR